MQKAPASGTSWKYDDLAMAIARMSFFDQCPYRMDCANCSFYQPKDSSAAFLVEGNVPAEKVKIYRVGATLWLKVSTDG